MDIVDRIFDLASHKFREQRDFAEALGKSPTMVSAWKNRVSKSYTKYLHEIATCLDTTPGYLLNGVDEKRPPLDEEGRPPGLGQLEQIYCSLNPEGQETLLDYAIYLETTGRYIKSDPAQLGKEKNA